jgi:hypothetical protein
MPTATADEREAARERLLRLISLLLRVEARRAAGYPQIEIRPSGEGAVESSPSSHAP